MPYSIAYTSAFKRDVKLAKKRGKDVEKLFAVIERLASGQGLPPAYRDHILSGNWGGARECHIEPDWLLVYEKDEQAVVLMCLRTGTHSDLF
ncbi:MAG TPA: type II toxin-antitoxin system YafQ family toxin [Arachnia sp.]|nr:type II toxin-antitoxin system YafQ family toxin [Arachnia sp.]HMT86411.1 type II toxin-antitoxin system YafQ family toxin [Arachnia sp.]